MHIAAVCLVLAGLVWACRLVHRRSRLAGVMFAAGLVIRASGALFFFLISYFQLPLMTRLQMGNGFWMLAPDAQEYYRLSSQVAEHWHFGRLYTITPGYVGPLALWMRAVGVHPASPALFSLVLYAVSVVAVVAAFGRARTRESQQAVAVGVAALSFSPMLIFATVFGLKDVFVTTLVVLLAIAYLTLFAAVWTRATLRANLLAAAGALVAIWLIAATRTYFAILMWAATAVAYLGCVMAGRASRLRHLIQAAVVLPALGLVIVVGGETDYSRFGTGMLTSVTGIVVPHRAPAAHGGMNELDWRRAAIIAYGGDSVFNRRAGTAPRDRFRAVAIGLAAVFVPSSILERLSVVDIHIRTAARLVADADTLVLDLTAAIVLWLLVVNRRHINPGPLIFALALAVLVALPLAYVMTNFGTLVRLRLMVATPIWLLTLALAPGGCRAGLRDDDGFDCRLDARRSGGPRENVRSRSTMTPP